MNKNEYAYKSLMLRVGMKFGIKEREIILPPGNDFCRIIYSGGRLVLSAQNGIKKPLLNWLRSINVSEEIRQPDFYKKVLTVTGRDSFDFELEPSEAFIETDKRYDGHHTLEYVCDAECFKPVKSCISVTTICRGEEKFWDDEGFGDRMYCVLDDGKICSLSRYRRNTGEFSETCAMDVFTRHAYERRGFAKATALEATKDACENVGMALWVCHVQNEASRAVAEELGYKFLGGELRIY